MTAPRIGRSLHSEAQELTSVPTPQVVGTIPLSAPGPAPEAFKTASWVDPESGVPISITEPPPPWEIDPNGRRQDSDARRFVQCPENVVLRWANPKLVSVRGLMDWQTVPAHGDRHFKLLVSQLGRPDNTVRRGDDNGDFLVWMYRSWYESRQAEKARRVALQTQKAVDRAQETQEQMRRGRFGQYITGVSASHPTHTIADGRTMEREGLG